MAHFPVDTVQPAKPLSNQSRFQNQEHLLTAEDPELSPKVEVNAELLEAQEQVFGMPSVSLQLHAE
jgi:hypothetical protein